MIGSWWRHVWHTVGVLGAIAGIVTVLWLASSIKNRIDRGRDLLLAAQPVVVAQAVQHQLSEPELAAKYHLSTAVAVRQAPKPGTKKKAPPSPRTDGAAGPTGQRTQSAAGMPSPSVEEQVETTTYPEQKLPRLPYGGTALPALTGKPSEEPAFSLTVAPSPRPRFQLGGLSRAGVAWDPIGKTFGGFVEHDFFSLHLGSNDSCAAKSWRCGRALVLGARPFASYGYAALPGAKTTDYGVPITLAVDF